MSELILHIGAHKTATTTIQKLLADSPAELARAGIVYPRVAWFQFAQHRLAFALKGWRDPAAGDRPDPQAEIAAVNQALAGSRGRRVLISSEELFALPPDALALLKNGLAADRVRVIACLRRPDEMLLSIYNQKAKSPDNGFCRMLEFFVNHPRQIDPDISYGVQLGKWLDAFPAAALSVYTYEAGPPVERFFAELGMSAPPAGTPAINRSSPAPVVELMRMAKAFGVPAESQPRLYAAAMQHFADAPMLQLTDAARRRIVATLQDEYDALFRRLGRPNPYTLDALAPRDDAPAELPPNLTFRDLVSLIGALV